jgi:uncharacterized protein YbjT (DUF2867 family)
MILITGITGRVGSSAAKYLLKNSLKVRGLTRDRTKAMTFVELGADIFDGDICDKNFVRKSLKGVETVILVTGNGPHQLDAECLIARESLACGIKHIVKISSMEAGPDAVAPIPKAHYQIEQCIEATGLTYTFLRPNFFMQNLMLFANSIKQSKQFSLPLGKAKTGLIDADDVGEIVGRVASSKAIKSSIRALSGDILLDFHEVASLMSNQLGAQVSYQEQTHEDFHANLAKAIPSPWHVNAVSLLFKEIAKGALASTTTDARDILERHPIGVEAFVERHRSSFV